MGPGGPLYVQATFARQNATRFPGDVAGLLMETDHEDYDASMPCELIETRGAWDPDQELPDELPEEPVQLYRGLTSAAVRNRISGQ
jgi:hypothetical protein